MYTNLFSGADNLPGATGLKDSAIKSKKKGGGGKAALELQASKLF